MKNIYGYLQQNPIWLILTAAVLIRLIFLIGYSASPDWELLAGDPLYNDRKALEIAGGDLIGDQVFHRGPLYIYLLGAIYAIFGHSLLAARIFGMMIGLAGVLITFLIARRLFGNRVAIVAGVIHALYPMAIFFESELLVDSLFALFFELSFLLLIIAGERRKSRWYILTGLVIGLAAITRPVILGLLPIYIVVPLFLEKRLSGKIIGASLLLLMTLLVILPVTVRNLIVADDFVPVSSLGGVNLYIGNNAEADGLSAAMPAPLGQSWTVRDIRHVAETDLGQTLSASELSDYWFRLSRDWILENPVSFMKLYLKKLYFWINNFPVSNNRNLVMLVDQFFIFRFNPIGFGLLFSLAVAGIVILAGERRFDRSIIIMVALIGGYIIVTSFFFINMRFKLPALPFLIVLAAYGASRFYTIILSRAFNRYFYAAAALAVMVYIFSITNLYNVDKNSTVSGYFNRANFYMYTGEYGKSINLYRKVLSIDARYHEANLNLGALFFKMSKADSAEYYFKRELSISDNGSRACSNLASLYYLRGEYQKALEFSHRAIATKPYLPEGWLLLMRCAAALNDTLELQRAINQATQSVDAVIKIDIDAGLIYSERKEFDRAESYLKRALERTRPPVDISDHAFGFDESGRTGFDRMRARAAYQLGYIMGLQNNISESISYSSMAIRLDSSLAEAYINLASGYLSQSNRLKAKEIIEPARERFPENEIIETIFNRLQ